MPTTRLSIIGMPVTHTIEAGALPLRTVAPVSVCEDGEIEVAVLSPNLGVLVRVKLPRDVAIRFLIGAVFADSEGSFKTE